MTLIFRSSRFKIKFEITVVYFFEIKLFEILSFEINISYLSLLLWCDIFFLSKLRKIVHGLRLLRIRRFCFQCLKNKYFHNKKKCYVTLSLECHVFLINCPLKFRTFFSFSFYFYFYKSLLIGLFYYGLFSDNWLWLRSTANSGCGNPSWARNSRICISR